MADLDWENEEWEDDDWEDDESIPEHGLCVDTSDDESDEEEKQTPVQRAAGEFTALFSQSFS